jgi:hypothetical protein
MLNLQRSLFSGGFLHSLTVLNIAKWCILDVCDALTMLNIVTVTTEYEHGLIERS